MRYSDILIQAEKALSNIDIVAVTRVEKIKITENSTDVIPGKEISVGEYGSVDVRLLFPLKNS